MSRPRSAARWLAHALVPWDSTAGFFLPHLIVLAAAVALAFGLGLFAGSTIARNTAYYRAHYQAPLTVPHVYQRVHVSKRVRAEATDAGSIHMAYFTSQTDDQGNLGACEAWAFTKSLSYAANWNVQPNGWHWHRFYAPRFLYDAVSSCQDAGSYLEQYPPAVTLLGVPQWTQMPYGPAAGLLPNSLPDFAVDCPTPAWAQTLARLHHLGVTETQLFPNQGAGPGGLALIHQQLATHHMVAVDLPVFPEYDQANADGSTVTLPLAGEADRGGHANDDVRSDPSHNNGDGTQGADLLSNQWSKYAGVGADGIRHAGPHNGFVWVSWSFIEQYVWDAAVIHVPANSPGAMPPPPTASPFYVPSHAPTFHAPPIPKDVRTPKPQPGAAALQVTGIRTRDTGVDISASINAAAARYGFSAPGYAALMGTESNINQYAPHYPINGAGYCDYSGGLTQITVCTAAGLGIGNGSLSQANINYVFWYEQADANRDVAFSARLVDQFHHAVCWDWYELYSSWNLGPGYGCYASIYQYPSNSITQQAVANFKGWLSWVYAGHVRYGPPPPPPPPTPKHYTFPAGHWNHYRNRHHLPHIAHQHHGKLTWAASVWWSGQGQRICRYSGITRPERWLPRLKVMRTDFARCILYTWPTHPGSRPKIARR